MLLLTMLSLLCGVKGVAAQQAVIVWFDPMAGQVNVGETTTVKLIVDAQNAVNSFDLTFEYDPKIVLLDSWTYGGFLTKLSALKNEATPGRLWLVSVQLGVPPVTGAGVLLEFTLRGVAPGTSALTFSQVKFADALGVQYNAGVTEGAISVVAGLPPTSTLTLAPTATLTLVPTQVPTATTRPATQAPTATRTSIPIPQPTSMPRVQSTATRTLAPTRTLTAGAAATSSYPTATRPANGVGSTQSMASAQPGLQQTTLTKIPAAKIDAAATQTIEANLAWATLEAMSTAYATDPTVTQVRPTVAPETAPVADEENSKPNLTAGIILFDLIVLAFIVYLLWRRGRKNLEGKS